MDSHPQASFRPAKIGDTASLAVLVDIAGEGLAAYLWGQLKTPGQSILEVGRERARREEGGFSYRNATLAEIGGETAGALIGYRQPDPYDTGDLSELPEFLQPLLQLESQAPGSWYVNVLAVFPEFRRLGLGKALLDIADQKAWESNASSLSVIVASWNEEASKLYARAGFRLEAEEEAIPFADFSHHGAWQLLVKAL
ncbi:GNAT family N-acetyltransferase [Methyloligella sp. 2.7D]|uniref:GNAT family N-acetyltransferase n=1 Tax=unclassified Methyloligella TaxID=2625955 RepID=UPI00157BEB8A|nr:GNAT family N-acetyltransferase [Methyloligella sp. GL2]QKP77489.1 GNAT family N-acetyltransferase [Methyloligella sp. GL2]